MPATTTLSTTTLSAPIGPADTRVRLTSTSGLLVGTRLFVDGELMRVQSLDVDSWVNVKRGIDGTASVAHDPQTLVYIGEAHQFYCQDPVGRPQAAIPVSPYINVSNGAVWFARGDASSTTANRWWQRQTTTYVAGSLGIPTTTLDPTVST